MVNEFNADLDKRWLTELRYSILLDSDKVICADADIPETSASDSTHNPVTDHARTVGSP